MKISLNWLRRYLSVDLPAAEIAELLTYCGLEVEAVIPYETVKGNLAGVVTGAVLQCSKHPGADRLSLTLVDIGQGTPIPIVCGAPNVAAGQKVLVATVGTTLYKEEGSFQIQKATIRGQFSEGMICAEDELGLGTSHAGIMVLPDDTPVGIPAASFLEMYSDTILEIGLTPNRADAFSHTGVARDLLAVLKNRYPEKYAGQPLQWPDVEGFVPGNTGFSIPVEVQNSEACHRYCGMTFEKVQVGESPVWMQNLLKTVGLRPINNIVDITNYVMLETGQPLHAFDADAITGGKVVVKTLPPGTSFVTLDGVTRILDGTELMICNAEAGMCIAGVYGGQDAGVEEKTTRIFLESACFNPVSVRKTSRIHGLKTDSSQRFERGTNPDMPPYALKRAALLFKEYAGAVFSSDIQDVYPSPVPFHKIRVTYDNIAALIGKKIPEEVIKQILSDLEIQVEQEHADGLSLLVPPFKTDVTGEADIIEEILRIYGYNNIELGKELRYSMVHTDWMVKEQARNRVSEHLSSHGFSEIMCNSLTRNDYVTLIPGYEPDSWVTILNPLSKDQQRMRATLLPGGLETIVHNQNRRNSDLKLYEFGTVYRYLGGNKVGSSLERYHEEEQFSMWMTGRQGPENWYQPSQEIDFTTLKAHLHSLLVLLGIEGYPFVIRETSDGIFDSGLEYAMNDHPKDIVLMFGEVSSSLLKAFDIKAPVFYASFSWEKVMVLKGQKKHIYEDLPRYPWVRRDLALLLDAGIAFSDIEKIAFRTEKVRLKKVGLFDVYEGDNIEKGKKSYAVSFMLQDDQKTLTDEEIDGMMDAFIQAYQKELGAVIR